MKTIDEFIRQISDQYCFLLPLGLGDTLEVCSYLKDIEKKLNKPIHLLIKQTHEFIVKDCNITNYTLLTDLNILATYRTHTQNCTIMQNALQQYFCSYPTVGKIFQAHPGCNRNIPKYLAIINEIVQNKITFNKFYQQFFDINDTNSEIHKMSLNFLPSNNFIDQIMSLTNSNLDNILLFIFECHSLMPLTLNQKQKIIENAKKQHPTAVVLTDDKLQDITLQDLLYLATQVKHVYAYKSGLCDILVNLGKKLTVFYPDKGSYYVYSAQSMYKQHDVDEKIL